MKSRRIRNKAETLAYYAWINCKPVTAMTHLAAAGYSEAERRAFLEQVIGLSSDVAADFAYDSYIVAALLDPDPTRFERSA